MSRREQEVPAGAKVALAVAAGIFVAPFLAPVWLRGARGLVSRLPDRQEVVALMGVLGNPDNYKFVTVKVEGYYSPIKDPSVQADIGRACGGFVTRVPSYIGELRNDGSPDSPAILMVGCETQKEDSLPVEGEKVAVIGQVKDVGRLPGPFRWIIEVKHRQELG